MMIMYIVVQQVIDVHVPVCIASKLHVMEMYIHFTTS